MTDKKYVWLVRQTQPSNGYNAYPIAVYDEQRNAVSLARRLNKVYGENCVFDEDWDFVEYDMQDDPCYYDVDCQVVNPDPNNYLWSADE